MPQNSTLIPTLSRLPLFHGMKEESLLLLTEYLEILDFSDGATIFKERDPGGSLYIIESGSVVVSKIIDWDDMTEKTLATLPTGAFFGEGGIMDGEVRSANVRAVGATRAIRLKREAFLKLLDQSPLSAMQIMTGVNRVLNDRLRQTSHELVTLFDTGKIAGAGYDLLELLDHILERSMESTTSTKGMLFLINPYTEELELGHYFGMEEPLGPFERHQGLFRIVLESDRPFLSANFPESGVTPQGFEPTSLIACAIRHQEVPIGMIVIGDREGGASYDGGHSHLLQGICLQVASAIENAHQKAEDAAAEAHKRHYVTF
jgi:CRP-like cAMP-binding protein